MYDYISVNSIAPHNIKIDNKLQRSCLAASSRQIEELNKAKAIKKLTAQHVRKKEIKKEINVLSLQILNLNTYIENLKKQSNECFRKAGAEKDLVAIRQLVEERMMQGKRSRKRRRQSLNLKIQYKNSSYNSLHV